MPYLLGAPDHTGTSVFLLVSVLLIDRVPARCYTPPLLFAILCAGQIGDATVLYVAVPAVVVVCGYRAVAARKVRTGDAANALAAAASVPLASVVRAVMRHFGAYQMAAPKTAISAPRWPHNAALAWHAVGVLFGAEAGAGSSSWRECGIHPRARLLAGRGGGLRAGGDDLAYCKPGRAAAVRRDRHQPLGVRDLDHADTQQSLRDGRRTALRRDTRGSCLRARAHRRHAAGRPGGRPGRHRCIGAIGYRGRPARGCGAYSAAQRVAQGAPTHVRPRRLLGQLGCYPAVGQPGAGSRGRHVR